jgi:hypothetical protein
MTGAWDLGGPLADVQTVVDARDLLDRAMLGFNRHCNLVERYRLAAARFQASKAVYEAGGADRERWREARAAVAAHRETVRVYVREYVHRLRDEGVAPERVLMAVKQRLFLSATAEKPGAPLFDATSLERDASRGAIEAYFEAA